MALISTIRNSKYLLIVLLGVGLLAFILMDVTMNQNRNVASDFTLGKINGDPIDYKEFRNVQDALYSGANVDNNQVNDYLWNYFLEKEIVENEASELGLSVGKDELLDLQFGQNLSPIIRQRFGNQQTGQVDREQLNQFRQAIQDGTLPEQNKFFWRQQENEIIKTRLQTKLNAMVGQGIYTPSWMAESQGAMQNSSATVAYVSIPFAEIDDTELSISDEDYSSYLNDHANMYKQDQETRVASYVKILVEPTAEDSMKIKKEVEELIPGLIDASNDSLYAIQNNGYFSSVYNTKTELGGEVPDTLFSMNDGAIYGPEYRNGAYIAYKVIDRMVIPDSIEARHILIKANPQDPTSISIARAKVDSLKNVIESGDGNFGDLAVQFGEDATNAEEGSLGTFGRNAMVKPFNDLVFYKAEEGKLYTVTTQFGVHLIEVTDQIIENDEQGIKFVLIQEAVMPSLETQNAKYDAAIDLINNNNNIDEFRSAIESTPGLKLTKTNPVKAAGFNIDGIDNTTVGRSITKWLYSRDEIGEVSPDIFIVKHPTLNYSQEYVIATRDKIIPEGMPSVDDVKDQIKPEVMKLKKGEMLASQIGNANSLAFVASSYGTDVDTLQSVKFSSTSIMGLGSEPALLGAIFSTPANTISKPVIGNNGVYVFKTLDRVLGSTPSNLAPIRKSISQKTASKTGTNLLKALIDKADIDDRRNKFF